VQKLPVRGHGDWTPVNTKPISGTTFTVPNLVEGSEFEFRVVAINDAGPGKPSKSTGPHKVRDPICKLNPFIRRQSTSQSIEMKLWSASYRRWSEALNNKMMYGLGCK